MTVRGMGASLVGRAQAAAASSHFPRRRHSHAADLPFSSLGDGPLQRRPDLDPGAVSRVDRWSSRRSGESSSAAPACFLSLICADARRLRPAAKCLQHDAFDRIHVLCCKLLFFRMSLSQNRCALLGDML